MVAFLVIALFIATTLAVVVALADSAVRGRNAWKAIRREITAEHFADLPANDAVVVQMRPVTAVNQTAPSHRVVTQMPRAFAA